MAEILLRASQKASRELATSQPAGAPEQFRRTPRAVIDGVDKRSLTASTRSAEPEQPAGPETRALREALRADDDLDVVIMRQQSYLIRQNALTALLGTEVTAGAVALATYLEGGSAAPLYAFGCFTLIQVARWLFILIADLAGLPNRRPAVFLMWASVGSLVTGLSWMTIPLLSLHWGGPHAVVVAVITVAGVSAGAVLLSAPRACYALLYSLPAMLGAIMLLVIAAPFGVHEGWILASSILVFGLITTLCAVRAERLVVGNIRLAYERSRLADSLREEGERTQVAVERYEFLAMHDPLTGLLNRSALTCQFQARLTEAARTGRPVAVMVLDLDHFKQINDMLGHPIGDKMLVEVAERIKMVLSPQDLVCRLGGDEFAVLVGLDHDDPAGRAQALIDMMEEPFRLGGRSLRIGMSLGVALCPDHGDTISLLMSRADVALYAAKEAGRLRWVIFDERLEERARIQQDIEAELRVALRDGQICYHYQPQIRIQDRRVIGLEALLRWDHPTYGRIDPGEIIAAAHRSNQVEALIICVLESACQMLGRLERIGFEDVRVAVNVSPRDFDRCDVAALVEAALARHQVAAARLEVEITEDAMLETERAGPQLARLDRLGVPLAIDDFGVGYSSIARLTDMKIDRLKIDRSFVSAIEESECSRRLFEAITAVGRGLKVEMVAEGIETVRQLDAVKWLGCDIAQGYLVSPPLPQAELLTWLQASPRSGDLHLARGGDAPVLSLVDDTKFPGAPALVLPAKRAM